MISATEVKGAVRVNDTGRALLDWPEHKPLYAGVETNVTTLEWPAKQKRIEVGLTIWADADIPVGASSTAATESAAELIHRQMYGDVLSELGELHHLINFSTREKLANAVEKLMESISD